jgi:hypothetical protein
MIVSSEVALVDGSILLAPICELNEAILLRNLRH